MNLRKKSPSLVRLFDDHGYYAGSTTCYHGNMLDTSLRDTFIINQAPTHTHIPCKQNHTAIVAIYNKQFILPPEFDGIVTKESNTILSIITADCVPVVYIDPHAHVMGISHQGWRGTFNNLASEMIDTMITLGAKKNTIYVAIGPCIRKESYEVDRSLLEQFIIRYPDYCDECVHISSETNGYLDLPTLNKCQLVASGIIPYHIYDSHCCTYTHKDLCYSYRRQGNTDAFGEILTFVQNDSK